MGRIGGARRRKLRQIAVLVASLSLVSACGSRLAPEQVVALNGGTAANGVLGVEGGPAVGGSPGEPTGESGVGSAPADSASGRGGSGGAGSSTGGSESDSTGGDSPAVEPGAQVGSCDGLKNQTGVTDRTITLGTVADISGPVPGLFQSAHDAVKAYVAFFNASASICGRKLELVTFDSRSDAVGDQQAYTRGCDEVFAMVGSMSAFDQGGAGVSEACTLPDLRALSTTAERYACSSCFSSYGLDPTRTPSALPRFLAQRDGDLLANAAVVWTDVQAAQFNGQQYVKTIERAGGNVVAQFGIPVAEINYSSYVQRLRDAGAASVLYFGPAQFTTRLLQAMRQQNYRPQFVQDPQIYTRSFAETAGDAGEGVITYMYNEPFNSTNPEMKTYLAWLEQVRPGADPDYFGVFSWSAARLTTDLLTRLGGKLSRESFISELRGVSDWTARGLHTPMDVGGRSTSGCLRFLQFDGSSWKQISPGKYTCDEVFDVG